MTVSTSWSALHLTTSSKLLHQLLPIELVQLSMIWGYQVVQGIEVQQRGETCLVICSRWVIFSKATIHCVVTSINSEVSWKLEGIILFQSILTFYWDYACLQTPIIAACLHHLLAPVTDYFLIIIFDPLNFEQIFFSLHIPNSKINSSP